MTNTVLTLFGMTINFTTAMYFAMVVGMLYLFYRIHKTKKLEFADMITKDGKGVSLTKLLQLIGGMTATWIVVRMTMQGSLQVEFFVAYLGYVASVEGFSKFITAKYRSEERSTRSNNEDLDLK
jgi:hypothetical protein